MSEENTVGPATVYEIINKATGEVFPVSQYGSSTDEDGGVIFTAHLADGTPINFAVVRGEGNETTHVNDVYDIREVSTHSEPDGTGTVEVETTPEGEVEITHSDDEESAPETAGEAETTPETVG